MAKCSTRGGRGNSFSRASLACAPSQTSTGSPGQAVRYSAATARDLLDAAPMPAGNLEDFGYSVLDKLYRRYMPSPEVIEIMRFLYMLGAAGVTTGEKLRQLIEGHNQRIAKLKKIPDLHTRKLTLDRLDSGMFSNGARDDAVSNFNDHGRVAFNARTLVLLCHFPLVAAYSRPI
ncbi:MAG: hypothetical protein ACJ8AW_47325 [Rhodopila sp.]